MSVEVKPEIYLESQYTQPSERPEDSWPCPSEVQPASVDRQRQSVIQIDTPGCRITVSPEKLHPIPPPRPREIRGRGRLDIAEWVSRTPDRVPVDTPVVNRTKDTSSLRIVFDAKAKDKSGSSLNGAIEKGPNRLNDLFAILLRFRRFQYAFTAA